MTVPTPASSAGRSKSGGRTRLPRGEFATLYLVAVVLGSAAVKIHITLPVLVMALYLAYGLPRALRANVLLEFTDSFYYLGFTITVASLLLAMLAFGGERVEARSVHEILRHYATGLATTVIGVIGRTALQLFFLAPDETAETRAREITRRTEEFVQALEALNGRLTTMLGSTFETLQGDVARTLALTQQELQSLSKNVQRLATSIADVRIDPSLMTGAFGAVEAAAQRATAALDGSVSRYAAVQQQLGQTLPHLSGLGQELNALRDSLATALGSVREFGHALPRAQLDALTPALTVLTQQLKDVRDALQSADWQTLGPGARSLANALKGLQAAAGKVDIGALSAELSNGVAALQQFQQGLAQVGLPGLRTAVDQAASSVDELRNAIRRSIGSLDGFAADDSASLTRLKEALRTTSRHVDALQTVLREIADAVRSQVARL